MQDRPHSSDSADTAARISRRHTRSWLTAISFASPWLVGLLALFVYPFVVSLYWSFCRYDLINPPRFVGTENYEQLATEFATGTGIAHALWNTGYYAFLSVPLSIVLGVGLATLLSCDIRGQSIFRTLFYLPSVIPVVAASILWMWLLNPADGLVNSVLGSLGLWQPQWFASPEELVSTHSFSPAAWQNNSAPIGSKDALILMSLWGMGNFMVIYLAAIGDIPKSLYEAARIDGAGPIRRFTHVTLPLLTPIIFFNLVMGLIQSVQAFTQIYIVSEGRGAPADSTLVISLHLFLSAFQHLNMGYASAVAWLLFTLLGIATWFLFRTSRRWVYEGVR
ncbi:carbohydrate ABC transporter permease [Bremerella sp. T1]|uniref:carbohydrate ABC transporter permease n=1 Tax=Bremerella sp. TYQ1 TaxID=3119568 RepID=UPI001CCA768F|nr:sugar ABC transporter permease [Bremerella volcania]UBM34950.1 sugar ABC transporter permease [Bremerella volcania]